MKELTTRERLLHLIESMPGAHLRMAQRALGMSIGTVVYHVRTLQQEGLIRKERQGGGTRASTRLSHRQAGLRQSWRGPSGS